MRGCVFSNFLRVVFKIFCFCMSLVNSLSYEKERSHQRTIG